MDGGSSFEPGRRRPGARGIRRAGGVFLAVCAVAAAVGWADRTDSRPGDGKRPLKVPPPSERRHLGVHEPSILGGPTDGNLPTWPGSRTARASRFPT